MPMMHRLNYSCLTSFSNMTICCIFASRLGWSHLLPLLIEGSQQALFNSCNSWRIMVLLWQLHILAGAADCAQSPASNVVQVWRDGNMPKYDRVH